MTTEVQSSPQPVVSTRQLLTWGAYAAVLIFLILWLQPAVADKPFARVVQTTITGLLVGGVYSLIALGIVIINKASGVFNFAHGVLMLIGGLIFYTFFSNSSVQTLPAGIMALLTVLIVISMGGWRALRDPRNLAIGAIVTVVLTLLMTLPGRETQLIRALVGGVVGVTLIGLSIERFTIRPLIGQPLFTAILMTLALSEVLSGLSQMVWGSVEIPLNIFGGLREAGFPFPIVIEGGDTFLAGDIRIRTELLFAFGLALLAFGAFVLFFRYTNVGLAMRATAENQQLAQSVGLRVRFVLAVAWGIAALLAATAGIVQAGASSLSLNMPLLALRAFPAVLLGGLESISGAMVGGIVIGLVQEWSNLLFPGTQAGTELAPYVVLMIVLVIRPEGLFGQKRIDRI